MTREQFILKLQNVKKVNCKQIHCEYKVKLWTTWSMRYFLAKSLENVYKLCSCSISIVRYLLIFKRLPQNSEYIMHYLKYHIIKYTTTHQIYYWCAEHKKCYTHKLMANDNICTSQVFTLRKGLLSEYFKIIICLSSNAFFVSISENKEILHCLFRSLGR